jgi:hypothetical protein
LTQQQNPYPSGVSDEKGLPKDDQVTPPMGFEFPIGGPNRHEI